MTSEELNNETIIKNISTNQKEILYNIMKLYNNGEPFDCDMTASTLKFYERNPGDKWIVPEPRILFDVCPQMKFVHKIEPHMPLPLDNDSIHSIVIDLPFVVSPPNCPSALNKKKGSLLIYNRFSGFYPVSDLYSNYYHWIAEAYRVLDDGGICVFKCQSTVSGGVEHSSEEYSFMCAQRVGFYVIDKFTLRAKSVLISAAKYNTQQHARKYTSSFYVFKKDSRFAKKVDYNKIITEEHKKYKEMLENNPPKKIENLCNYNPLY